MDDMIAQMTKQLAFHQQQPMQQPVGAPQSAPAALPGLPPSPGLGQVPGGPALPPDPNGVPSVMGAPTQMGAQQSAGAAPGGMLGAVNMLPPGVSMSSPMGLGGPMGMPPMGAPPMGAGAGMGGLTGMSPMGLSNMSSSSSAPMQPQTLPSSQPMTSSSAASTQSGLARPFGGGNEWLRSLLGSSQPSGGSSAMFDQALQRLRAAPMQAQGMAQGMPFQQQAMPYMGFGQQSAPPMTQDRIRSLMQQVMQRRPASYGG